MILLSLVFLLASSIAGLEGAKPETSRENLRSLLTDHFTTPRHHVTNRAGLAAARDFIYDTFKSYHMQVARHQFALENNGERFFGVNVVGLWPGRNFMTRLDRPVVLTAHYESPYNMAGVEDNGSGLAALLETARIITSQPCLQDSTVVFTAFDFSANFERDLQITPCATIACGCREFLKDVLVPFINDSHIGTNDVQGFFVMDALLNYNNTPGAQIIPNEDVFRTVPGLVDAANAIRDDGYRGNFVAVVSREFDSPLADAFNSKFDEAGNPQFKRQSMTLPFTTITDETKQDPLWPLYKAMTDADVRALHEVVPDEKAVFLTDTVDFRGREKEWQSLTADDSMTITDERLDFLKKIADALTRTVIELTGHKETCSNAPPDFVPQLPDKGGLQMSGTLHMSDTDKQDVSLTVHSVQPHGVLNATMASQAWSLYMIGVFDPLEHVLHLYIPQPFKVEGAPGTISCRVYGKFDRHDSTVTFAGRMRGHCSPTLSFFGPPTFRNDGLILLYTSDSSKDAGSSSPSLALPVVLSLLGGMVFSAALAAVAWFVYTRRLANSSANSLPMKENQ